MNTDGCIAWTLRIGIVFGIILIIIGEMMAEGNAVLWMGVLILILSPLFGIIVAFLGLLFEKDWFWTGVAAVVLIVIAAGLIIATT